MTNLIISVAIAAIGFTTCQNGNTKSTESRNAKNDSNPTATHTNPNETSGKENGETTALTIKKIVDAYLQLKNALVNDNSKDAASAGVSLGSELKNLDKSSMTPEEKKVFEDVAEDASMHSEHIGENAGNIKHQREHFDMLSKDIYDLVKAFGSSQLLYKDFCPMYNDKKGAFWLSETKDIKNPYYGKAMLTCGSVKEEIKQK
jgi:hypothetical protein